MCFCGVCVFLILYKDGAVWPRLPPQLQPSALRYSVTSTFPAAVKQLQRSCNEKA